MTIHMSHYLKWFFYMFLCRAVRQRFVGEMGTFIFFSGVKFLRKVVDLRLLKSVDFHSYSKIKGSVLWDKLKKDFRPSGPPSALAKWKKSARRRRKHCALAVVRQSQKIFARRRPSARDGQNLISWRPLPTNPVWWGSMQAISSYRANRPTNTATNRHTNRTDYNTLHCS